MGINIENGKDNNLESHNGNKDLEKKLDSSLLVREKLLALMELSNLHTREFLDYTLDDIVLFTGSKIGYIFLYNEEKEEFLLHSWSDVVLKECMIKDQSRLYYLGNVGLWGEVVRRRQAIIINNYEAPNEMKKGYPEGHVPIKNFISIPVFDKDRIVAVVGAANKKSDYNQDDVLNITLLMNTVWPVVERFKSEEILLRERELLKATILSINEGIIVTDSDGKITLMNPIAEKYTGWLKEEAYGQDFSKIFNNVNLKTRAKGDDPVKLVLKTIESSQSPEDMGLIARDGSEIYISGRVSRIVSLEGTITGAVVSFQDITKEYQQEKEIEAFLNVNLDMLSVVDLDAKFIKVNNKFKEVLGYEKEELEGQSFFTLIHEDDINATIEKMEELANDISVSGFTNRYRCKDGTYKYIEWQSQPGVADLIYSSARDVTETINFEEKLRKIAIKDRLTGLYNRNFFDNVIEEQMERSDRYDEPLSIVMLDLDNFKEVNDNWGHPIGDEVLKMISRTIENAMRSSDILVRFGGEEFLVLMPQTTIKGALQASEKIRVAIENSQHQIAGVRTASFGVAERMKSESFRHWYRRIDNALYNAKQNGRNQVVSSDGAEIFDANLLQIEWKNEWNCKNNNINNQHQELVRIGNKLIVMTIKGISYGETLLQLESLIEHTKNHFESEEKLLKEINFPEYSNHVDKHRALTVKVLRLKEEYEKGQIKGSTFFSFLLDDIVLGHMVDTDSEFYSYI